MHTRIREVRKALKMTMDSFGQRIGVAKSTISNIENGSRNVSEHMAKSICREFNVNYEWLVFGEGEMFTELPQTILDELCRQYDLDDIDRSLFQEYLKLAPADRQVLKDYIRSVFLPADDADPIGAEVRAVDIEAEVEAYRRELEIEASRKAKSSASAESGGTETA